MATLEQIIDEARALSPAEKGKLRQVLDRELEQQAAAVPSSERSYPSNEQERAWISAHRDEYLGQWVTLDGDRLVAHGTDAKKVYDEARELGSKAPYLERVSPKQEAFMGGWQ